MQNCKINPSPQHCHRLWMVSRVAEDRQCASKRWPDKKTAAAGRRHRSGKGSMPPRVREMCNTGAWTNSGHHCATPLAQRALWLKRVRLPVGESNPSLPRDTHQELHEILLRIKSRADPTATDRDNKQTCFRPVSNRGPFACKANVITTTLRKPCCADQKC